MAAMTSAGSKVPPSHGMPVNPCTTVQVSLDDNTGYIDNIDEIRRAEYPALLETTYLDHAGTTPYARSLIDSFAADLAGNLFGNPHSVSQSSLSTSKRINDTRLQVLRFFTASPDDFDVIFTANATAAVKLVADVLRDHSHGFHFNYHCDSHTSIVGIRAVAHGGSRCLTSEDITNWLTELNDVSTESTEPLLFTYPAQSNMTGQRYSLEWCKQAREVAAAKGHAIYTLLDAAAFVSTAPLDFSDIDFTPDFTAVSFYKIFGFPDVGALIVRKSVHDLMQNRMYFGGGTVDSVAVNNSMWYARKENLHDSLEDGTLPFHNIIALQHAFKVHRRLYGSMQTISRHVNHLTCSTFVRLKKLKHDNNRPVCKIYSLDPRLTTSPGPVIAFNLLTRHGNFVSNTEVEKLAIVKGLQFRTGTLCNPGGAAAHLDLTEAGLQRNYAAGQRCGGLQDLFDNKPTGMIRVSFGAMSNMSDVASLVSFLEEYYVEDKSVSVLGRNHVDRQNLRSSTSPPRFTVESLSVFPIKSCAGYRVPAQVDWEVLDKGLRYDREWCLVHQGTNIALSQKQFPQMALLQPSIDLRNRHLIVSYIEERSPDRQLVIDLDVYPESEGIMDLCGSGSVTSSSGDGKTRGHFKQQRATVCGEKIVIHLYPDRRISEFFSTALGVPCTLARYPRQGSIRRSNIRRLMPTPDSSPDRSSIEGIARRNKAIIQLSNESPILLVSRSSVDWLNEQIQARARRTNISSTTTGVSPPKIVHPESFRGNIVIAEYHPARSTVAMETTVPKTSSQVRSSASSMVSSMLHLKSSVGSSSQQDQHLHQPDSKLQKHVNAFLEDDFLSVQVHNKTGSYTSSVASTTSSTSRDLDTTTSFQVLGPCQRCQMVCIDQKDATRSVEPFSTLAKTRKMGGRVWFGIHLCLSSERDGRGGGSGGDDDDYDDDDKGQVDESASTATKGNNTTTKTTTTTTKNNKRLKQRKFIKVGDMIDVTLRSSSSAICP